MTNNLKLLACLDSPALARQRQRELQIGIPRAASLGMSAVMAARRGYYINSAKQKVDLSRAIESSCASKMSVPPGATLPEVAPTAHAETLVQVTNETTLGAAHRLHEAGLKPLALNFANGINPGGGFLHGARAQEEVLCRSSALYSTLVGDEMYEEHRQRIHPDSTDWAIYSPCVPVFRTDEGQNLDAPWILSFITCGASRLVVAMPGADYIARCMTRIVVVGSSV